MLDPQRLGNILPCLTALALRNMAHRFGATSVGAIFNLESHPGIVSDSRLRKFYTDDKVNEYSFKSSQHSAFSIQPRRVWVTTKWNRSGAAKGENAIKAIEIS